MSALDSQSESTKNTDHAPLNGNTEKLLTRKHISPNVLNAAYAVRGAIVLRAGQIKEELKSGNHKYNFNKVIMCNIGNPQSLGQIPLTFNRQVLSCVLNPFLLTEEKEIDLYPNDVIERAKSILSKTGCNSTGAYTHSQGYENVRESVCNFIIKRDKYENKNDYPCKENIFLTDGASPGIKTILKAIIYKKEHGVMVPIPQYPLYSATISLLGGTQIPYYLNETKSWSFEIKDAQSACNDAKKNGIEPRALVIINPGNPTGQCLNRKDIESAIMFAKSENMIILADEVYQENVYNKDKKEFVSFRKVLKSMSDEYKNCVELVSFHSVSKGILGECGLRGGYMELCNIEEDGISEIYKLASISLCPNTTGQIAVELMCNPPKPGDLSYNLFKKECDNQYESLKRRADILSKKLNEIDGIETQIIEGAMYAFPTIKLPKNAIEYVNNSMGISPDQYYCMQLLEQTGICVVPGSGFGQQDGTFHFRITILPPENEIEQVVKKLGEFHIEFIKKYS